MSAELDAMVARFLSRGAVVTPCAPGTKRAYFEPGITRIRDMDGWRAAKSQFGSDINAAALLNASGLCVFDFDDYHAGTSVMNSDALPPYFVTRTISGFHLYYLRMPWFGFSGTIMQGDFVEPHSGFVGHYLSGDRGNQYAMLPGSIHPSGAAYTVYCGDVDCIGHRPALSYRPYGTEKLITSDMYIVFDSPEYDYGYDYDGEYD